MLAGYAGGSDLEQGQNLGAALDFFHLCDNWIITKFDHLGRNVVNIVITVANLPQKDINPYVLETAADSFQPANEVVLTVLLTLTK